MIHSRTALTCSPIFLEKKISMFFKIWRVGKSYCLRLNRILLSLTSIESSKFPVGFGFFVGLSVALFAPGWVFERAEPLGTWKDRSRQFWNLLDTCHHKFRKPRPAIVKLPFQSNFCNGCGTKNLVQVKFLYPYPSQKPYNIMSLGHCCKLRLFRKNSFFWLSINKIDSNQVSTVSGFWCSKSAFSSLAFDKPGLWLRTNSVQKSS